MKATGCATTLTLGLLLFTPSLRAQDRPERDRPPQGVVLRTEKAVQGYTLLSPLRSTTTYLVDLDGKVVHEWPSKHTPGNAVYLLENGNLLRTCHVNDNHTFRGGGSGGRIQEMNREGELLWDYAVSSEEELQHHDIEPLPNGNVLVVAWEARTREEALAAGRDPEQLNDAGFWPGKIIELEPLRPDGAKIVWEWHAWDHLVQDLDPEAAGYGDITAHPELIDINADHRREPPMDEAARKRQEELLEKMRKLGYVGDDDDEAEDQDGDPPRRRRSHGPDWLHVNSVDYHPELDLVLLSSHSLSEVWVIDHSTTTKEAAGHAGGRFGRGGDLLYRWGNPRNYGAGNNRDQRLFRQHDARFLTTETSGELRFTVFNNGEGRPDGQYSSVDEIAIPFDPERGFVRLKNEAFGPGEAVWSYGSKEELFFSSFISGAHRLTGGNTLICSGAENRVFEVTVEGEIVWDYRCPFASVPPGERPERPRNGDRGDRRRRGPMPPPPGGQGRGRGGPGGRGGAAGLFRATRIPSDHPGLAQLLVEDGE
jgi:hypothetical protein